MKVAVFGSTGYGGQVLLHLLLNHPAVEKLWAVSSSRSSTPIAEYDGGPGSNHPEKLARGSLYCSPEDARQARPDAVFLALPHGSAARIAEEFLGQSVVFDLSADFRLRDARLHREYYGSAPPLPKWRSQAVYGLPELYREALQSADLVALPGCYPTSILLPLLPLARAGLLASTSSSNPASPHPIVINSLSGISGAGRTARIKSLYVERAENTEAYSPGQTHRHYPEIAQELSGAGSRYPILFTPHLIPMRRGLLSTINLVIKATPPNAPLSTGRILASAYKSEPFIRLLPDTLPRSGNVLGSNRCDIGWTTTELPAGHQAITLCSAIDNLMKGASGQGVQAMNIRFALPETAGLSTSGQV